MDATHDGDAEWHSQEDPHYSASSSTGAPDYDPDAVTWRLYAAWAALILGMCCG